MKKVKLILLTTLADISTIAKAVEGCAEVLDFEPMDDVEPAAPKRRRLNGKHKMAPKRAGGSGVDDKILETMRDNPNVTWDRERLARAIKKDYSVDYAHSTIGNTLCQMKAADQVVLVSRGKWQLKT